MRDCGAVRCGRILDMSEGTGEGTCWQILEEVVLLQKNQVGSSTGCLKSDKLRTCRARGRVGGWLDGSQWRERERGRDEQVGRWVDGHTEMDGWMGWVDRHMCKLVCTGINE